MKQGRELEMFKCWLRKGGSYKRLMRVRRQISENQSEVDNKNSSRKASQNELISNNNSSRKNTEEKIEKLLPNEKLKIRMEKAKPILEEMKVWVDEKRPKVTPKSVGGKAINYFFNEYQYLIRYL
jgi:hypothetical protein